MSKKSNPYKKAAELAKSLRSLAKKHNIVIMTATQPTRKAVHHVLPKSHSNSPNIVVVDHLSSLKHDK